MLFVSKNSIIAVDRLFLTLGHPGLCAPCKRLPAVPQSCACGKTTSSSSPSALRPSCVSPLPTCDNQCGKPLDCGLHMCSKKCHDDSSCGYKIFIHFVFGFFVSGKCFASVAVLCRCGSTMPSIVCDTLITSLISAATSVSSVSLEVKPSRKSKKTDGHSLLSDASTATTAFCSASATPAADSFVSSALVSSCHPHKSFAEQFSISVESLMQKPSDVVMCRSVCKKRLGCGNHFCNRVWLSVSMFDFTHFFSCPSAKDSGYSMYHVCERICGKILACEVADHICQRFCHNG